LEAVYLVLGLCVIAGLAYVLMQVTARQRRLNAEMTRLERLAAEVTMNAEVVLEQVDLRIERLQKVVAEAEAKVAALQAAPPATPAAAGPPASRPAEPANPAPEAMAAPAPEPEAPAAAGGQLTSMERYQQMRTAVWTLADQGRSVLEIAQALGVPRGEVQLLLNLRGKKVTA